jgi:phage terminase large subunit
MRIKIRPEVFNDIFLPHLENRSRTQIFFGGAASGKSVFLAQRCIYDLLHGGRNYLVCRQVGRTLRGSVYTEILRVINGWGVQNLFTVNKTDMLITCQNGHQIIFASLDDAEKLKSVTPARGALTDIWIEEATECEPGTITQLYKRQRGGNERTPKRLTMSFNPVLKSHWLYQKYFSGIGWADGQTAHKTDELSILKTWYVHNRFLTDSDRRDLEAETDRYYYEVYTLGNWGMLGNVIFTNWQVRDLSDMQAQFVNRRNGLDFGFSSDPAALSRSHYDRKHKTIYIFAELYERGLTNDILAARALDMVGGDLINCDSAEPKSIQEIRNAGVNATAAKKGADSVMHGIQWLQQQTIIIDKSCINAQNEFSQYHWREDRDGNAIRQPVEKNDHLIDATRYAYEYDAAGGWYIT